MNVQRVLKENSDAGRCSFIPFIPAGLPDVEATCELIDELYAAGSDVLELGVPYNDPNADGPTIMEAYDQAISRNNVSLSNCLKIVEKVRGRECSIPIVLFSYFNPIHKYGIKAFCQEAKDCGVDAVLVVDLPVDEIKEVKAMLDQYSLGCVLLVSPTTEEERILEIIEHNPEFIYLLSLSGVTGAQRDFDLNISKKINFIRNHTDIPVCLGFGIATKDQFTQFSQSVDGIIVGSALTKKLLQDHPKEVLIENVLAKAKSLIA